MDTALMNQLPFIAGMRATPRRIVKSFFIVTVMGFLLINMNLLLRSVDDESPDVTYQSDPAYMGHVPLHRATGTGRGGRAPGNGAQPIEPAPPHPRHLSDGAANLAGASDHAPGRPTDKNSQSNVPPVDSVQSNGSSQSRTTKDTRLPVNRTRTTIPPADQAEGNETAKLPRLVEDLLTGPHHPISPDNATFIKEFIAQINREQKIHNLDKFDLSASSETVVVVVQVHNRANYLLHLLASLRKARHVERTLLIFSHDFYDAKIMEVVKTVDFCPTMQIFYPFPNQIYTKEYPGEDPKDCGRDLKKDRAVKLGCNNAQWPDKYGHYREAKYAQTKHHWFWKINHVFDTLHVTRQHVGPVLFIEEDHYLVPDFIHVLNKMLKFADEHCKECGIFTLGTYDKNPTYTGDTSKGVFSWLFGGDSEKLSYVETTDWVSNKHNMGMALNRPVWNKIKRCYQAFCRFDDYNWDWSLQFTSFTCVPGRLKVMLSKSPRIFHIGECGVHHKGKNCNPEVKVNKLEELLRRSNDSMFPTRLALAGRPRSVGRTPKPNGGWSDQRDVTLCSSFTHPATHR